MTSTAEQIKIWRVPEGVVGALGVAVPVGPAHDPVAAVITSDRAARRSGTRVVHLVVLNGAGAEARAPGIEAALGGLADRVAVASVDAPIGYINAVRHCLLLADELQLRSDRIGFLDADATLRGPRHWHDLEAILDMDSEVDAASGLVVHERCRIWETLSSAEFVAAMERATGGPIHKPYLQGGAGGTLARRQPFETAVDDALRFGTLIGPTLSATSIAAGRRVMATSQLPCGHTPRRTMQEWSDSVTAYERSWRGLIDMLGSDIEKPWQEFLAFAERVLINDHRLLVDFRYNTAMRQQIVTRVVGELQMLKPGAAR